MRNYRQTFQLTNGVKACDGVGCVGAKMDIDESMRLDALGFDGTM